MKNLVNLQSLKEEGWKPVSSDAFELYIYRRLYGWVATLVTQPYKRL